MQSFDFYIDKLNSLSERYSRLCELLTFEEVLVDKKLFLKFSAEKRQLEDLVQLYREYNISQSELQDLDELKALANDQDEYNNVVENIAKMSTQLDKIKLNLVQKIIGFDSEQENICVEIVSVKNNAINKLMEDLMSIYSLWCDNNGFEINFEKVNNIIKISISGKGVKTLFAHEVGIHETVNGEYSCAVFVYDANSENQYTFSDDEVSIEICRSSGAGGQHINTTDSSVRVTHIPTGISAICQDERNQLQNKIKAIERLKDKVDSAINSRNEENIKKQKKPQLAKVKSGGIVRIYDFKNRIIIQGKDKYTLEDFEKGIVDQK